MQVIPFLTQPDEALLLRLVTLAPLVQLQCCACSAQGCIDLRILGLDADEVAAPRLRSLLRCRQCGSGNVRILQAVSMAAASSRQQPAAGDANRFNPTP